MTGTSTVALEAGQSPPRLGLPFEKQLRRRTDPGAALAAAGVPLLISGLVSLAYFVVYWVPELRGFPGEDFLLNQLSPLASKELTSQGQAVEAAQVGHHGLGAAFLLVAACAVPALARARFWLARLALLGLVAVAAVVALGIVIAAVGRGLLADTLLGLVLVVVWVVAAVRTAWRSLGVDPTELPPRPVAALWLLPAYALITPIPVAVGRSLFGTELREAALEVADGGFSVRWAALIAPSTFSIYAVGLLIGILVAIGYLVLPPRQPKVPLVGLCIAALVAFVLVIVAGVAGASAARARVEQIRTGSPVDDLGYRCAAWTVQPPDEPVRTLVVSGTSCNRVRSYSGYREIAGGTLDGSVSPVRVETLDGKTVSVDTASARFGDLVVVAGTERFDNRATRLTAVRIADAAVVWTYACKGRDTLRLRFAGGDDAVDRAGLSVEADTPAVTTRCGSTRAVLDPQTGRARR